MAANDLYPLSSQRGDAIPLEIIKPLSLVAYNFIAVTSGDITIPASYNCCWLYATKDCILAFTVANLPAALVSGTEYLNTIFIPANSPIAIQVTPGEASLLGLNEDGILYMNSIQQWAGLVQNRQAAFG